MQHNFEIKNSALAHLENRWADMVLLTLVYFLIYAAVSVEWFDSEELPLAFCLQQVIMVCVSVPMSWGYGIVFLNLVREDKGTKTANLFDGFRSFKRVFFTELLMGVYVLLWTLLFIVPGIVKGLSYAMTPYVLKDNSNLAYDAAIERSMDMMQGHKLKLFWLLLSFIGWAFLALLTFGIGYLWLAPYYSATMAQFYVECKADYEARTNVFGDGAAATDGANAGDYEEVIIEN